MCNRLFQLLIEIARGDDAPKFREPGLPRMLRAEEGMMTWATLVAVVLFCTLIAMLFNVGRIANDKLEAQNAADSAAYSASLVQARAMNALTASNHMMGELTALYTMHHAIGGKVLDDGRKKNNLVVIGLNAALWVAYGAADVGWVASLPTSAFNIPEFVSPVDDIPRGEATVYDSKCLLKEKMIEQYVSHAAGSAKIVEGELLCLTILGIPKGLALIAEGLQQQAEANNEMRAIKREYRFITSLETFAISTKFIKKNIIPAILTALWSYERLIAGLVPGLGTEWKCLEAAKNAAEKNMCEGEVVGRPSLLAPLGVPSAKLAVVKDPTTDDEKTQLMRATYPWIQEWRWPILINFDLIASRSRAARFYEYHSDRYAKEICEEFRVKKGYKLFVLEQMNANRSRTDKGTESWRTKNGSSLADKMFCVVGLARKSKAPANSHLAFLPNTNPKPISAMAQAMIYNGNRPVKWERKTLDLVSWALGREAQPVEGWDTLNWTEGATEWKQGKSYFDFPGMIFGKSIGDDILWMEGRATVADIASPPDLKLPFGAGVPTPKIKLNWQSKLVPVAPKNLALRIMMIQDSDMRDRMIKQVLPGILSQQLGAEVIHH